MGDDLEVLATNQSLKPGDKVWPDPGYAAYVTYSEVLFIRDDKVIVSNADGLNMFRVEYLHTSKQSLADSVIQKHAGLISSVEEEIAAYNRKANQRLEMLKQNLSAIKSSLEKWVQDDEQADLELPIGCTTL